VEVFCFLATCCNQWVNYGLDYTAGVVDVVLCHGPLSESGETQGPLLRKMYLCACNRDNEIYWNEHFWSLDAINYFVAKIRHWIKTKFQIEVSENKVLIFSPSRSTDAGVRGPQVTNCCYIGISTAKRPDGFQGLWPTPPLHEYRQQSGRSMELINHIRLGPRLRMSGTIPPLPHMHSWRGT
jgi:hypothetical protein